MYIDNIVSGVNPLKPIMAKDSQGRGVVGQLAQRYEQEEAYAALRQNPDFTTIHESLQKADTAILAAAELIKEDNGRLVVGKPGKPDNFDALDESETAFFTQLAQARVALVSATRKCREAMAGMQRHEVNRMIDPIEWQLAELRHKVHGIHPHALIKMERLAETIAPEQFSFAIDALRALDGKAPAATPRR